ncbi:hypothetical protein CLOP_g3474 [Closterium sp. NIES-67]|nr:hypothetical protein CLOP_g3474 [Closterium sp. NIES-67]
MVSERKTAAEEAEQLSAAAADSSSSSRSSSGGWVVSGQARARSERVASRLEERKVQPPPRPHLPSPLLGVRAGAWSPAPFSLPLLPLSPPASSITP